MKIHYARAGSGAVVLLLHGIGSNSRAFRHQLADLCDAYTLVAWDAPGYGQSEDPAEPFSLADLADEAMNLLDTLGVQQAHVLGHSMGGVVAQLVYHRHSDRVLSLILSDTNPGGGAVPEPDRSERVRQRLEVFDRLGARGMAEVRAPNLLRAGAPADLLAEVTDIMAEVRAPGYCSAAIALGATDLSLQLSEIRVPTLVIHGDQDSVVPLETGRHLAERIPGARLVVIQDAGHASNQEQPEAFNAALRQFLQGIRT